MIEEFSHSPMACAHFFIMRAIGRRPSNLTRDVTERAHAQFVMETLVVKTIEVTISFSLHPYPFFFTL